MSLIWNISEALEERNISNSSQLQKALENSLGLSISRQSLHKLLHDKPRCLRVDTLQVLCTLLQISASEFLDVTPDNPEETLIELHVLQEQASDIMKLYRQKPASTLLSSSDPRLFLK